MHTAFHNPRRLFTLAAHQWPFDQPRLPLVEDYSRPYCRNLRCSVRGGLETGGHYSQPLGPQGMYLYVYVAGPNKQDSFIVCVKNLTPFRYVRNLRGSMVPRAKFESHRDDRPNGPRDRIANQASLPSDQGVSHLPPWGQKPSQVADRREGKLESPHKQPKFKSNCAWLCFVADTNERGQGP